MAACSNADQAAETDPTAAELDPAGLTWSPQYDGLADRVEAAGFPPVGDESYHVHALLSVFRDGQPVVVPANIGIDQPRRYLSALHTHTPDGVIHFEADDPAPFTLGQVFDIWGVEFDSGRLGDMVDEGTRTVQVYLDGEPVESPRALELSEGDNVVVAYGEPGSFPTEPPTDALDDL